MKKTPKPRDPSSHLRSAGALRQRVIRDRTKYRRKTKHKGKGYE